MVLLEQLRWIGALEGINRLFLVADNEQGTRVLRPLDPLTGVELPNSVRDNCALWAECIGGAQESQRYLRQIEQAGFKVEKTHPNEAYSFSQDSTQNAAEKFRVHSISILARRP